MSTRKQSKGFLWGALAGGVIGSITALLLAPKAGKELRRDISDQAQKVSDATVKAAGQVSDATGRFAKQIGEQAAQITEKTRQTVSGLRLRNKDRADAGAETECALIEAIDGTDKTQESSALEAVGAGETEAAVSKEL